MATATYQTTIDAGCEPDRKAISAILVEDESFPEVKDSADNVIEAAGQRTVRVAWWPSLLTQTDPSFVMSKTDVKTYLEAEALWAMGFYTDARTKLTTLASGTDTRTYDGGGNVTGGDDGRNWAQRWVDEHPDPAPVVPAVDPLM